MIQCWESPLIVCKLRTSNTVKSVPKDKCQARRNKKYFGPRCSVGLMYLVVLTGAAEGGGMREICDKTIFLHVCYSLLVHLCICSASYVQLSWNVLFFFRVTIRFTRSIRRLCNILVFPHSLYINLL